METYGPIIANGDIPQVPQAETQIDEPSKFRLKFRFNKKILFLIIILGFISLGLGGGVYAYNNVYLSPERVLKRMSGNFGQAKNYSYKGFVSFSYQMNGTGTEIISMLTPNTYTLDFDGKVDVSDLDNLKGETNAKMNLLAYGEINFDLKFIERKVYLKVNNIPNLGDYSVQLEPLKNQWILMDFEQLSNQLTGTSGNNLGNFDAGVSKGEINKIVELYKNNMFIVVSEKLDEEEIDGVKTLHYSYYPDKEKLRNFLIGLEETVYGNKSGTARDEMVDQILKDSELTKGEIWIGKKDSLPHKITLGLLKKTEGGSIGFDLELNFSDFDRGVTVEKPSSFKSIKEVIDQISGGYLVNQIDQLSQARDAQRKVDIYSITNAIYQYAAEHNGNLPQGFPTTETCMGTKQGCFDLSPQIVPTYIAQIPSDPKDGSDEDTKYTIYSSNDGRVVVKATGEMTPEITIQR